MFRSDVGRAGAGVAAWMVALALAGLLGGGVRAADAPGHGHEDHAPALTAKHFRNAPKDLVLWGQLAKVGVTRHGGRYHVTFLPPVLALDGKTVALVGFMTTVHPGERHTQFLLTDRPFLCDDCHSAPSPAGIVEVNAKVGQPARGSPIMVRGTLELVKDDPNGLVYRLRDAKVIRRL